MKYENLNLAELKREEFDLALKLGLINSVKHNGVCRPGSIISGLMGEFSDLKARMKLAGKDIAIVASKINDMDVDSQRNLLLSMYPDALDQKEEGSMFQSLNISEDEKVITAFPPGPEKYSHIGHAKALIVNFMLAKEFSGQFFLRFEDTNPRLVKKEYYEAMMEDFKWLGVEWDKVHYASDHIELFYEIFEKMLKNGEAYICELSQEEFVNLRDSKQDIPCRSESVEKQLVKWDKLKKGSIDAVARLKIDLYHQNSTMRDPVALRLIKDVEHPRLGNKYVLYPSYDFQNSIMDGYTGVTHRYRSKEFEMRRELQALIQKRAGYKITNINEFARFELEGAINSGRQIREKINSGEISGWDHPSLTTLRALKRRGFAPEVIKEFVLKTGLSKNEAKIGWDELILISRRFQDKIASRRFFVKQPKLVKVVGGPVQAKLKSLPEGDFDRTLSIKDEIYVDYEDFTNLKEGQLYRLLGGFNCVYKDGKLNLVDSDISEFKKKGKSTLHYVPVEESFEGSVMMPDGNLTKGYFEDCSDIDVGQVLQFERFGFVKKDSNSVFWFTHS